MGPGDVWQQAAAKWNEVVAQVSDDQMDNQTTCDDWMVSDLIEHTMHWQAQGAAMLGAQVDGEGWAAVEPALGAALADPANLEGTVAAMGDMPKHQAAGFVIGDLLVHSWDLAQSVGVDATLPEQAVQATMMGLSQVPEEMLRGENMFGAAIEVADDASAQEKLLAFLGRQA